MSGDRQQLKTPPFRGIGALLDEHRRRAPDNIAIIDVERDLAVTFAQLADAVDDLGLQLQQRGIERGSRVILAGSHGIERLMLWLGLWRIGAVVCPLDLSFVKPSVFAHVVATLRPPMILAPAGESPLPVAHEGVQVASYGHWSDDDASADIVLRLGSARPPGALGLDADASLHDIACISCTSGTTGNPKLVVYDHLSYWENGLDSAEMLALGPQDRLLEYRSFDWYSAQILSLMPFLQTGLTLCVARRFSRTRIFSWIAHYGVTVSVGVPAVVNILLQAPVDAGQGALASLRAMTCSSAPLSRLQWQRFEERYGIHMFNLYGSSEAGWICGNRPTQYRIGTVGIPAPHIGFAIVDANGEPCAAGQEGNVVVSGAKLALGLLRADGALDPIRGAPYYTRDAAIRDEDGFVRMLGRMDDLIIRGGVKIAPQEIEEVLLGHEAVHEAAALGVPDEIYGQEPACFVAAIPGAHLEPAVLLAHCRQHLPHEKMPKYLYVINELPRNSRGKLMRQTLRRDWWTATHGAAK